jgi:hypothetical protein
MNAEHASVVSLEWEIYNEIMLKTNFSMELSNNFPVTLSLKNLTEEEIEERKKNYGRIN